MNRRLRVYVAGKYSADNVVDVLRNIGKGRKVCAILFNGKFAPFCPWHDASYVIDFPHIQHDKKEFYDASIAWLKVSDAVLVISGEGEGGGVDAEIKIADDERIPVFRSIRQLLEWRRSKEKENAEENA